MVLAEDSEKAEAESRGCSSELHKQITRATVHSRGRFYCVPSTALWALTYTTTCTFHKNHWRRIRLKPLGAVVGGSEELLLPQCFISQHKKVFSERQSER